MAGVTVEITILLVVILKIEETLFVKAYLNPFVEAVAKSIPDKP